MILREVMFCPKCGSLMHPKNGKWVCSKCGYEMEIVKEQKKEKIVEKAKEKEVIILENELSVYPVDDTQICPKCGNRGAYYMVKQTRAADEPETRFFICTKCGYRWREY
ncbi:MAG: transcription factor S [Thermoplasmata archaeon]